MRFVFALMFLVSISASPVWAAGYDELMQKTQSGLAAYLPAPAPAPPHVVPSTPPAALWTPPIQKPSVAPVFAKPVESVAPVSLASGMRLTPAMHGIRKEGNRLIVRYTFESASPVMQPPADKAKDYRLLDATERAAVREVLEREIPARIPLQFELTINPEEAYLRVMGADLAASRKDLGFATSQELGYANLPHPLGGQLVLGKDICTQSKPGCPLLKSTIRHEVGHVLGLRHAEDAQVASLMQPTSSHYTDYQPQDIASLQQMYGTLGGTPSIAATTTTPPTAPAPSGLLSVLRQMLGQ